MSRRSMFVAGTLVVCALSSTAASAGTGCNGVIEPQTWGCAPWDNNNGPQFKYWKGGNAQKPAAQPAAVAAKPPVPAPALATRPGVAGAGVVSQGGGNVVSQGGGNVVSQGAGNVVSQGAGNVVSQGAGNFKGNSR